MQFAEIINKIVVSLIETTIESTRAPLTIEGKLFSRSFEPEGQSERMIAAGCSSWLDRYYDGMKT